MTEANFDKISELLYREMKDVTVNADDWPTAKSSLCECLLCSSVPVRSALRTAAELYQPDSAHLPLAMEMEVSQSAQALQNLKR